jgi:hypothetical protein
MYSQLTPYEKRKRDRQNYYNSIGRGSQALRRMKPFKYTPYRGSVFRPIPRRLKLESKYFDTNQLSGEYVTENTTNQWDHNMCYGDASLISLGVGATDITGNKGKFTKMKANLELLSLSLTDCSKFRVLLVQAAYKTGGLIDDETFVDNEFSKIFSGTSNYYYRHLNQNVSDCYKVLIDKSYDLSNKAYGTSIDYSSIDLKLRYKFTGTGGTFDVSTGEGLCYWLIIPDYTANNSICRWLGCFRSVFVDI